MLCANIVKPRIYPWELIVTSTFFSFFSFQSLFGMLCWVLFGSSPELSLEWIYFRLIKFQCKVTWKIAFYFKVLSEKMFWVTHMLSTSFWHEIMFFALGCIENNWLQLKKGQKWNCPTSIFSCKTNNTLCLNSFFLHFYKLILSAHLFVTVFFKVYKCKKFPKLVGDIKLAFPLKTFDFLSERKDRRDQRLCHMSGQNKALWNNNTPGFPLSEGLIV